MTESGKPDLTRLPELLARLDERGRPSLASQLLEAGWEVLDFRGPEQMDVWSLTLRRRGRGVVFGIERGFVEEARLGPVGGQAAEFHPFSLAVLGWARSCGAHVPFDDPDDFHPDLAAHGRVTLDWLEDGNDDVLGRIVAAREEYSRRRWSADQRLGAAWLVETKALGVRDIEVAAAPRESPADVDVDT